MKEYIDQHRVTRRRHTEESKERIRKSLRDGYRSGRITTWNKGKTLVKYKIGERECSNCGTVLIRNKHKDKSCSDGWRLERLCRFVKRRFCSIGCGTSYRNKINNPAKTKEARKKNRTFHRGKIPWNKNLTKKTDSRVMEQSSKLVGIPHSISRKKNQRIARLNYLKNNVSKFSNTKPEIEIKKKLDDWGINYVFQCLMYDKFIIDFYLPDQDIVLEVDGRYWHSLDRVKKRDKSKNNYLTTCGHRVVRVWDDELDSFSKDNLT